MQASIPFNVFDVNATLLDLDAIAPVFERLFTDKTAIRLWLANLILYSAAPTIAGQVRAKIS